MSALIRVPVKDTQSLRSQPSNRSTFVDANERPCYTGKVPSLIWGFQKLKHINLKYVRFEELFLVLIAI